jgi:hypothetical protein
VQVERLMRAAGAIPYSGISADRHRSIRYTEDKCIRHRAVGGAGNGGTPWVWRPKCRQVFCIGRFQRFGAIIGAECGARVTALSRDIVAVVSD